MDEMKSVEQVIGTNLRALRKRANLTQENLGAASAAYFPKPWSVATVSVAEAGRRAWVAADMLAICKLLNCSFSDLLIPAAGTEVQVTEHLAMSGPEITELTANTSSVGGMERVAFLGSTLRSAQDDLIAARAATSAAAESVASALNAVWHGNQPEQPAMDLGAPDEQPS